MINYIIQVILFQALFVAVYDFFLSKETFFTKNRWYLLSTSIVSFLLPLFKIPTIQKAVSLEYTILLPEVILSPQKVIEKSIWYQSVNYLDVLFVVGSLLFLVVFIIKLLRIIQLIFKYGSENKQTYKLVFLPENSKAFSFFNYIFLGKGIPTEKQEKIIQHELVHSKEKHTFDLLFFEFLRIFMWFNPMVYVYQKRITLVHEYISDDVVSKTTKKESYINNLLSDIFQVENISFINQFYKHSLIKKRIIMMTKKKSKEIKQLKYLLLIPLLASMVLYTACSENEKALIEQKLEKQRVYTDLEKEPSIAPKESYMDIYLGGKGMNTKELTINNLTLKEKEEYLELKNRLESKKSPLSFKIHEGFNNRRMIVFDIVKIDVKEESEEVYDDDVPFAVVEKVPTFPGCEEGDKACLNKSIQGFVVDNFNIKLANTLGLKSGKKRIYVQFKIDKDGSIIDVNARAPHSALKEEALRMMSKMPKLIPGEHKGKKVKVGYVLPITFNIN